MFTVIHVALSVTNLENSISFYKRFGFEVYKKWKASDLSIQITLMKLKEFTLELFCYRDYVEMPHSALSVATDLPVIGTKHFALQVKDLSAEIGRAHV